MWAKAPTRTYVHWPALYITTTRSIFRWSSHPCSLFPGLLSLRTGYHTIFILWTYKATIQYSSFEACTSTYSSCITDGMRWDNTSTSPEGGRVGMRLTIDNTICWTDWQTGRWMKSGPTPARLVSLVCGGDRRLYCSLHTPSVLPNTKSSDYGLTTCLLNNMYCLTIA